MNPSEWQAELRHFAAERDWQPFHTPKYLTTALMVEAAELAEIFQWMTPEESRLSVVPDHAGCMYLRPLTGRPRRLAPVASLKLLGFVGG